MADLDTGLGAAGGLGLQAGEHHLLPARRQAAAAPSICGQSHTLQQV